MLTSRKEEGGLASPGKEILEDMRQRTQQTIDSLRDRREEVVQVLTENARSWGASDPDEAALSDYYTMLAQQRFALQALDDAIKRS